MYIRFESFVKNDCSASNLGIVQIAYDLQESDELTAVEMEILNREINWLNRHLDVPSVFDEYGNHRAIGWFHPQAKAPINRVRSLCRIMEENSYYTRMVKSRDPGIIIYRDYWQVVAKPYRKNRRPKY